MATAATSPASSERPACIGMTFLPRRIERITNRSPAFGAGSPPHSGVRLAT
jgi:hypothetical protein